MSARKPFRFEKLEVWQAARRLGGEIYNLTQDWPARERFGLTAQLRRAVVSISANIAEGSGKNSDRDFARFLEQAYGSALEVASLLLIACDLGYVASARMDGLLDAVQSLCSQVAALNRSLNVEARKTVIAAGAAHQPGTARPRAAFEPSTFDARPSTLHES
jgi:four helix bundle protein